MSTLRDAIDDLRRSLREPPDEIMLEIGAGGELLVARLRVAIAALLMLLPLLNYAFGGSRYENVTGLIGAVLLFLLSQLWLRLAQRPRRYRWLPFVSSGFDVSLVSFVLWLLALNSPAAGLNSVVVWACYPLALLTTALRNDARISLMAGALAILQFALLSMVYLGRADGPIVSAEYGTVLAGTQIQRMILLLAITVITAVIVYRMQRLVQLSGTDGLTGLPNRTYLNHRVPQILLDSRADNNTVTLALIDLDHFKRINEELGHLAGDRALRHAVKTLRLELSREEPMMRVGGEEFVLILRLPIGTAWERMEQLRQRLEAHPFLPEDGAEPRRITLSAGLASSPQDAHDVSGLLKRADLRLRLAKKSGRNRVIARD